MVPGGVDAAAGVPRRFGTCDDQSIDGARGRDAGPDGGADPDPCSRHRYRDTRADDGSDEHAGAQSYAHSSHTHADPNGHGDADSRSDQYANADPDTCAAYTHADGDRHGDAHAYAYAFEHSHSNEYTYADSGTDSGR